MGADFYDYIIGDHVVIPEDQKHNYAENIIYLPDCYMPHDNTRQISNKPISRAECGLPDNRFVFCCFNNSFKISPQEFDIWMRLLNKIEGSVLWLLKANEWSQNNLRNEASKRGVDADRLVFADKLPLEEHLGRLRHADLFLDTFNFNAHTTASDALWAGIPVVTKIGKSFAARVAGSLLNAIELPELITTTEKEYEALALSLATDSNMTNGLTIPCRSGIGTLPQVSSDIRIPFYNLIFLVRIEQETWYLIKSIQLFPNMEQFSISLEHDRTTSLGFVT